MKFNSTPLTLKNPDHHPFLIMMIGALLIVVAPTIYGITSFMSSEAAAVPLFDIVCGLGFGSLALGLGYSAFRVMRQKLSKS
tara:strand:+ start:79 stop:324 length:246 start_codon:yes stop_codon:yes gene_type:complete